MKKYSSFFLVIACTLVSQALQAQCVKPTPMNAQQVQSVVGSWKGTYTCNGEQRDIEINITMKTNNEVECAVTNPPLEGSATSFEYFFCPGGEFHMRKYIDNVSYVFQGTPVDGRLKGIVSMYDAKNKRKQLGHFQVARN